ncbi:MAG: TAT-variant-translocated molybdopterin oxidoreductase [Planctomycetota bacterium]|nr:TAT-variant-translocated molybdopterin oxidoreductase [Planctomycetota bacterium]
MQSTPKKHWRSLAELEGTPEFTAALHREFPALEDTDVEALDDVSRRRFLQLMGASMALAGASSCTWEAETIVPMVSRPANRVPGKAVTFSSAIERGGYGFGVTLTSYDGRPIKVEGNPNDPISGGASDVFAQNAILEMYDPDRSRTVRTAGADSTWEAFDAAWNGVMDTVRATKGAGLAILTEGISSPTLNMVVDSVLRKQSSARLFEYESVSRDNEIAGAKLAFGEAHRAHYDASKAEVIVSFDGDLFSGHPAQIKHNRDWAKKRRPAGGRMGRMYAAESRFTVDGGMADHRLPVRSGDLGAFVGLVELMLAQNHEMALPNPVQAADLTGGHAATDERARAMATAIADDLAKHAGRSLLVAGPAQPPEVHARVHLLNELLGNFGRTVTFTEEPAAERASHVDSLGDLVAAINAGEIQTLIILEGNPVYDAPADVDFAGALAKVGTSVRLGLYDNETSAACTWHLPRAHAFEAWGDALAWDGSHLVSQPTIAPLWGARSALEFFSPMIVTGTPPTPDKLVRQQTGTKGSEKAWRKVVHDGIAPQKALKATTPSTKQGAFKPSVVGDSMEITFSPDPKVHDGRYTNSSWLQELPDFMTKLTWDNVAIVGKSTADKLGLHHAGNSKNEVPMLDITVDGTTVSVPVFVQPGQALDSINLQLGYGRTRAGQIGGLEGEGERDASPVGVDVFPLRKGGAWFAAGTVAKGSGTYELAMTQDHHLVDDIGMEGAEDRRGMLVREENLTDYDEKDKSHFRHKVHYPEHGSLWTEPSFEGHAWGMSIDLNLCNGCNACVIACQSENNIPVVGKEEVMNAREMHWIRIDRYFAGDDVDSPQLAMQPVNCQQCEMAPCEQVCPVAATTHSEEGLNDMVYNRCVGTRYCANNCPFKVRRFNYKNYRKNPVDLTDSYNEVAKLGLNPEVSVRVRGVMEKCTYCVQRIQETKIEAKNAQRPIQDGEIVTACQQACPPQAIIFGDKNDPESAVSKLHDSARAYEMLAELQLKPRNNFLAKIRNPHPSLVPAAPAGSEAAGSHGDNGGH